VTCAVTTRNTGLDAADVDRFELHPSKDLSNPVTTTGGPPTVLAGLPAGGGMPSQTMVTFRVRRNARIGSTLSVTLVASGRDETDRLPFSLGASSNTLKVTR
jgi:hypothetical protein